MTKRLKTIAAAALALAALPVAQTAGNRPLKVEPAKLSDFPKNTQALAKALLASADAEVEILGKGRDQDFVDGNAPLYLVVKGLDWQTAGATLGPVLKKMGYKVTNFKRGAMIQTTSDSTNVGQISPYGDGALIDLSYDLSEI